MCTITQHKTLNIDLPLGKNEKDYTKNSQTFLNFINFHIELYDNWHPPIDLIA